MTVIFSDYYILLFYSTILLVSSYEINLYSKHSDHEQLAKIMAEVVSSTSSPGVLLHEWLDEDSKVSKESLNDEEQINRMKTH